MAADPRAAGAATKQQVATSTSIFPAKQALLECFSTPLPDEEIVNAHTKLITAVSSYAYLHRG
jgi:hypothetical protein